MNVPEPEHGPFRSAVLRVALLFTTGGFMLWWTWATWADVLIDFGREVYVPWRILTGEVLYRDIAYFNGPFSAYLNAAFFWLVGPDLSTIYLVNLTFLAIVGVLLHRLLRFVSDPFAATVAVFVFLTVFAFGRLTVVGNYNFMAPYSHELTHGVLLSLGALASLMEFVRSVRQRWLFLCGVLVGATFLTKPEVFIAAFAACAAGLFGNIIVQGNVRGSRRTALILFFAGIFVIPIVAMAALAMVTGTIAALGSVTSSWSFIVDPRLSALRFYRAAMGFDAPGATLIVILVWSGIYLVLLGGLVRLSRLLENRGWSPRRQALWLFAGTSLGMGLAVLSFHPLQALRPLPVVLLVLLFLSGTRLLRGGGEEALRLAFIVFSLVLLAKILGFARAYHYGFALALPATMVAVVALLAWLPGWAGTGPASVQGVRAGGLGILLVFVASHAAVCQRRLQENDYPVGQGWNQIRTDPGRGAVVEETIRALGSALPRHGTMLVVPEGVLLNFLVRRDNPTPFVNFMPPEIIMFGEDRMLSALREHRPDVILVTDRVTTEYGYDYFGTDYARKLWSWIQEHYEVQRTIGSEPLRNDSTFGIQILTPVETRQARS